MADIEPGESERGRVARVKTAVVGMFHSLVFMPIQLFSPLVRAMPGTWRLYYKMHRWSAYQMQKASGADTLANVRRNNGKEDVLPAKWVEGGEDDKDLTGWKVKGLGGKRYDPAVNGRTTTRFGKADLIHINEDDMEQGTWAEAAMDNAFQLDRERYLFRDATVQIRNLVYNVDDPAASGEAVTDGGVMAEPAEQFVQTEDVSLSRPGILEDILVPIHSRGDYDGQVISQTQYNTLKNEQSDQSTLRDAKNSAWVAAKLDDVEGRDILKWAIIIGVWSFILLFHQDIGAFIAGLGGGGGGGGAVSSAASGLGMIDIGKTVLGVM